MKKVFLQSVLIPFLLFLSAVLLLPAGVSAASPDVDLTAEEQAYCERAGEITIGCPVNDCPMLFQDSKTGQLRGITIDILDAVAEGTGLTFRYQALPSTGNAPSRSRYSSAQRSLRPSTPRWRNSSCS